MWLHVSRAGCRDQERLCKQLAPDQVSNVSMNEDATCSSNAGSWSCCKTSVGGDAGTGGGLSTSMPLRRLRRLQWGPSAGMGRSSLPCGRRRQKGDRSKVLSVRSEPAHEARSATWRQHICRCLQESQVRPVKAAPSGDCCRACSGTLVRVARDASAEESQSAK